MDRAEVTDVQIIYIDHNNPLAITSRGRFGVGKMAAMG